MLAKLFLRSVLVHGKDVLAILLHQKIGEEEIIDYNLCYMFLLWMLLDDNQLFSLL